MKKSWLIGGGLVGCLTTAALGACGSSNPSPSGDTGTSTSATSTTSASGGGTTGGTSTGTTGGGGNSTAGVGGSGGGATTTIAAARAANVTTSITVDAVCTGLHGGPGDYSQWYIEDPAGGPSSGVAVYCDPDKAACPTIRAPALHDLVRITGAMSTYKGAVQFVPTAQTTLQTNAALPPIATVTAADLASAGNSPYRGVLVHFASKLTVDDATPIALYDTQCDTGADAGADAGPQLCTSCLPPTYSGFQANDGSGHEVYIEDFFFNTDHLQSSPECSSQAGEIPVTVGMTFSSITGILDYDPYGMAQALSPVEDKDYTTP